MSREDEARAFHFAVYDAVQLIPRGKVTTYGHIAKMVYKPRNSRQVGQALKFLPVRGEHTDYPYDHTNVPWWRVISSSGAISLREEHQMRLQNEMLTQEGVHVKDPGSKISLDDFGWFPETEFDNYE